MKLPKVGDEVEWPWNVASITPYSKADHHHSYTLRNSVNGREVTMSETTIKKIMSGRETLTQAISNKIQDHFPHYLRKRYIILGKKGNRL